MPNPAKYYKEVLLPKLTAKEIYDLLCILDDGLADELTELMAHDCRMWFPGEFKPVRGKRKKEAGS